MTDMSTAPTIGQATWLARFMPVQQEIPEHWVGSLARREEEGLLPPDPLKEYYGPEASEADPDFDWDLESEPLNPDTDSDAGLPWDDDHVLAPATRPRGTRRLDDVPDDELDQLEPVEPVYSTDSPPLGE